MKNRVAVAILVGLSVSTLLAVLEAKLHAIYLEYLQAPGFITIMWGWGHGGGGVPELVLEGVMIGVNAVFYGLVVFGASWLLGSVKNDIK